MHHRPTSRRSIAAVATRVVGLALVLVASAGAAPAQRTPARPRRHPASQVSAPGAAQRLTTLPAGSAGLVVTIEPETGRLGMPTSFQLRQLTSPERTGLLRTTVGLRETHLPDGTVMLDLQGRFMEFAVVRLDPTGRLRYGCADDAPALFRTLDPCQPAPAYEEK